MSYKHTFVYSLGNESEKHWGKLLADLDNGWEIVSTATDKYAIHYILRKTDNTDLSIEELSRLAGLQNELPIDPVAHMRPMGIKS